MQEMNLNDAISLWIKNKICYLLSSKRRCFHSWWRRNWSVIQLLLLLCAELVINVKIGCLTAVDYSFIFAGTYSCYSYIILIQDSIEILISLFLFTLTIWLFFNGKMGLPRECKLQLFLYYQSMKREIYISCVGILLLLFLVFFFFSILHGGKWWVGDVTKYPSWHIPIWAHCWDG